MRHCSGRRTTLGPFKGKTALLGTRITPETRKALEDAARESGRSLSQEAELLLRSSLRKDSRPDITALTKAIAMVIGYVEATARERWTDSAFVTATVRQAIDLLLRHWGAHEPPAIPAAIKELATRLPTDYASMRHDPAKVALEIGTAEAGRLIAQIESRGVFEGEDDPLNLPPSPKIHVPDKWREHRRILRGLGSGWKRRELREQGKKMLG